MTKFILLMVWREARGALHRFLFFLISIALGVASIVGVGNMAANFDAMTHLEARNLLAADVEARLISPLSEEGKAVLAELTREGLSSIRITELKGMAINVASGETQLVELKAIESGYPFYGRLKIEPPPTELSLGPKEVWVEKGLLIRLHMQVGDQLKIGEASFMIRGEILKEPDRVVGPFRIGPRVLLSQAGLQKAELIQTGSRIRHRLLMKTTSRTPEALKTLLDQRWSGESVSIKTYREVQPRLGRFLGNFTTYLGLVGLITLMIGGIGVASHIHAFLTERIETIAILKSLGASAAMLTLIYLLLALILGGIGALGGVLLGLGITFILQSLMAGFLPPAFVFQMTVTPIFRGITMGLLTTFLFALWPLRMVSSVPPFRIFRHEVEARAIQMTGKKWLKQVLIGGSMAVCWVGLSVWQAGSWRLGIWVVMAVGVAILLLMAGGKGMLALVRKIPLPNSLILRYGIKNLYRPGRQIMTIILSLGVGIMVLLTLFQVERRLMAELDQNIPEDAPGLFFIDIQPDQKGPLETMLNARRFEITPELTPLIRSRLHAVDGKKISEIGVENRPDSWYFTREYVLTYQKNLPEHNIILRGQWWKEGETEALISVDSDVAYHLGIDVESNVTFDIQGVQISGKVASVREVDWGSMTTNFYFIFTPAALSGAPETFVATVTTEPENDLPVQNAVIGKFPNVTVIPIREFLETIARILMEITRTVQVMASLGLLVGLIVLSGAIVATRARRVHEMVLFKTLGATRPALIAIMAVEYSLLGIVSAIVGGSLSIVVSWGVVRFFLDIPWQVEWGVLLTGTSGTVALTLLTGFLTTYRILGEKPLAILRAE